MPLRQCVDDELIEGYDILLQDDGKGSVTTIHVMGAQSRSYVLDPLSPATEFALRIAAVNSEGAGPYTRPVVFTTKKL